MVAMALKHAKVTSGILLYGASDCQLAGWFPQKALAISVWCLRDIYLLAILTPTVFRE